MFKTASTNSKQSKSNHAAFLGEVSNTTFIQPKLNIGKPGDKYEVEADQMADQVVAKSHEQSSSFFTPSPSIQKAPEEDIQEKCADCENEEAVQKMEDNSPKQQAKEESSSNENTVSTTVKPIIQKTPEEDIPTKEEDDIQKKEEEVQLQPQSSGDDDNTSSNIENKLTDSKGGGSPLASDTRQEMESGLGVDLSGVRIHNDSNAVQMNNELGAQAFTNGSDIYFNEGKYNPNADSGKHLLAHELTHTVQQGGAIQKKEEDQVSAPSENPEEKTTVSDVETNFSLTLENELGSTNTSPTQQKLPPKGEAKDRAKKEVQQVKSARHKMAADKEKLIQNKKETEKKNKGKEKKEIKEKNNAIEKPVNIQQQQEKSKVDTQSASILVDDIATSGPKSTTSLQKLKGNTDNPSLISLGDAIQLNIDQQRQSVAANTIASAANIKAVSASQKQQTQAVIISSHQQVQHTMLETGQHINNSFQTTTQNILQEQHIAQAVNQENKALEVTRLNETITTKRQEAENIFDQAEATVGQTGREEGNRGKQHADSLADRALELGRQDAAYYGRTEDDTDLAQDKAEAVMQVANRYARKLRNDGNNLRSDVIEQATEAKEQVVAEKEPTVSGFNDIGPEAETSVRDYMDQVGESLGEAGNMGIEQATQAKDGAQEELGELNDATDGRATALRAQGEGQIDVATTSALMSTVNMAGQASEMLDQTGEKAIEQINDAAIVNKDYDTSGLPDIQMQDDPNNPPQIISPVDNTAVVNQLSQNEALLNQAFINQANEQTNTINQIGGSTQGVGNAWVGETQQNMNAFQTTVGGAMDELTPAMSNQFQEINTTGHQQISQQVGQIETDLAQNVSDVQTSVDGSVDEANQSLRSGVDEGNTNADGVLQEVPGAMNEAAEAQESIFGSIGNWFSEQLADTWEAIKGMADWGFILDLAIGILVGIGTALLVGALLVAVGLSGGLLGAVIIGAAAGAAGFAAATMSANVRHGDPLFQGVGHAMILGAFVGAGGAIAGFFSMGLLAGAGVVALSAGVGTVAANLATGKDWDDHLLANMIIMGIFHVVLKPIVDRVLPRANGTAEQRTTPEVEGREPIPEGRIETETDPNRNRGHEEVPREEPVREEPVEEKPKNEESFEARINALKAAIANRISQLRNQINGIEEQLTEIQTAMERPLPNDTPNRIQAQEANRRVRTQVEEAMEQLNEKTERINDLENSTNEATSERQLNTIEEQLEHLADEVQQVGDSPMTGRLGIRQASAEAIELMERLKYDPLGDVNSKANKNHYDAARIEARNEIIQKENGEPLLREDGSPFSHIRDLQNAREALENVRRQLEIEQQDPLPSMTESGMNVILERVAEVNRIISRLDGFLHQIGWPASRPHRWIQQLDGTWVGEGDPAVMRPRTGQVVDQSINRVTSLQDRIVRRIRDGEIDRQTGDDLLRRRTELLDEYQNLRERVNEAETEVELQGLQQELQQLDTQAGQLERDIHNAQ